MLWTRRMASFQACLAGASLAQDQVIIYFPEGLPGFERQRVFRVLEPADLTPLVSLQSADSPGLDLWAVPVEAIDAGYSLAVSREDLKTLGLDDGDQPESGRDVVCLALLCAPKNGQITANLLAPVVVNLKTRVAVQAVRPDRRYSHRHRIACEQRSTETPCS